VQGTIMEEEEEGLSMCEMMCWFEAKEIKLSSEWLSAALSHLGRKATIKSIFEQFVFSRLEESYERPMKIPDKATKIVLTKKIIFQVINVVNVARPIFDQLKDELRTENNLTWFYGDNTEESILECSQQDNNEWKGRKCVMVTLSDGAATLKGIEYGIIEGFTDDLPIGSKIMIVDRVMCRRGVMVLKRTNFTILGGAFERDENEMTKVERLSMLLPKGKTSKIEPYLSRVKKEFDLNQRTISPFLRRLPPKGDPPSICPPLIPHAPLPIASAVVPPFILPSSRSPIRPNQSPNAIMPLQLIAPAQRSSPPRQLHFGLSSAAVFGPSVKMEEMDPEFDGSITWMEKEKEGLPSRSSNNEMEDSSNTTVIYNTKRTMPIIPFLGQQEMQPSQKDPLIDTRVDAPQLPCVKLTPQTLADRARHACGSDKAASGASIDSSADINRSIASYFQAKKTTGLSWNKKTQKVEPSSRAEFGAKMEGIEEGNRRKAVEGKMRENQEKRSMEERNRRDEEDRVIEYYDKIRRRNNEDLTRKEEEGQMRRNYSILNPQVSVMVVSTPTPCSYITPPAGFADFSQSKQIQSMASHAHSMEMPVSTRCDSSTNRLFLFGADSRPSVPMHLFGSPARIHHSVNQSITPFKKTKTDEQTTGEITEGYGFHGLRMNYISGEHRSHQCNNQSSFIPFRDKQCGLRSGYSSELELPLPDTLQMQPSVRPLMEIEMEGGRRSFQNEEMHQRYLALNSVLLKDVLSKRKFWMMPKTFHVTPLYAMIDRNLNIEQGLWDMKMKVVDESGEIFMCQLDHKLLEDLLGLSVEAARRVRESNVTQFHKFKDRGCKMFKSMERMDLVLNVEVTPTPTEMPTITKISTLPEVLSIL
ncbi:hypothetical protein PMAYCL1PPCAC_24029, partial [Pristionchus mayeri]